MRFMLFVMAGAAALAGVLRALRDGQNWELVTAVTLLAACVLFVGGALHPGVKRNQP